MADLNVNIKYAEKEDLSDIVDIYNQAVMDGLKTADTDTVTVEEKTKWFNEHSADMYPILVAEIAGKVVGWLSLSPYRPGRKALKHTSEVSYYIDYEFHNKGIATNLLDAVIRICPDLKIKSIFGIIIDVNYGSIKLMKKLGFQKWAHMPNILEYKGQEYGHVYYGIRIK